MPSNAPFLDEVHAAFVVGPVAINIASCNAALEPSLAQAYGCRISSDRQRITVFVSISRSKALLQDLCAGGSIAVVFSRPATHQTIQLKSTQAKVVPLAPGDKDVIAAYVEAFTAEIVALGYLEYFSRSFLTIASEDAAGVIFTPREAFEQTPGTAAGRRLKLLSWP